MQNDALISVYFFSFTNQKEKDKWLKDNVIY